jgi:primosomal replication protein N
MSDLNRVCLSGRVATEPELRTTKGGIPVVSFVFGSNRTWRDERGDRQQDALFLPVEVYGARAEALGQYKGKGSFHPPAMSRHAPCCAAFALAGQRIDRISGAQERRRRDDIPDQPL